MLPFTSDKVEGESGGYVNQKGSIGCLMEGATAVWMMHGMVLFITLHNDSREMKVSFSHLS